MGLFDFITGGSGPDKAQRLKAKVTQKYGEPSTRQKAITQLAEMKIPEASTVMMARFTVAVEPSTLDADEKDEVFNLLTSQGRMVVDPVLAFLRQNDAASSWAVRILQEVVPETEWVGLLTDFLNEIGPKYMRDPEKKIVTIHALEGKDDPRIAPALLTVLDDMADDVRIAGLKALGPLKYEPAREPILQLLTGEETGKRVQLAAVQALADSGFGVQGYREKVESRVVDPYFVDKDGVVRKRG